MALATIRYGAAHNHIQVHDGGKIIPLSNASREERSAMARLLSETLGLKGTPPEDKKHRRHNGPRKPAHRKAAGQDQAGDGAQGKRGRRGPRGAAPDAGTPTGGRNRWGQPVVCYDV